MRLFANFQAIFNDFCIIFRCLLRCVGRKLRILRLPSDKIRNKFEQEVLV